MGPRASSQRDGKDGRVEPPSHEVGSVVLGNAPLTVEDIANVARRQYRLVLGEAAAERLRRSREVVERSVRSGESVYGLNTGLGAGVDTPLSHDQLVEFQIGVTRSHSTAVGPALAQEQVRALMAARVAVLANGGAGVSAPAAAALVAALNARFHPVIPSWGSAGAADLSPLAHMAAALRGEGSAEVESEVMPASAGLARAGLAPMRIAEKDGHTLVAANSLTVGAGCLVLEDVTQVVAWSLRAVALNYEAFRASLRILSEDVLLARPAFGQVEAGRRLRALLRGSELWDHTKARRLQDPLSYRCAPQIIGALMHALAETSAATQIELNGMPENPLVDVLGDRVVPTANFDVTALVQSWERLGLALAHCASSTGHRIMKIMSPAMSGLPRFLSTGPELSGYAQLQKTVSALDVEIRFLANPLSLTAIPASDGVEDHHTTAPRVVAKVGEMAIRLRYLVAIELVVAAAAVEARGVEACLGVGAGEAYAVVRELVAPLREERAPGPDIARVEEALRRTRPTEPVV